ncbi:hypothetical protein HPB52_022251 [Rhipicephalus sanguineus]|uniref:Reverse transcriptase domain-containing protein n=1 Tax=Rhipicephalus sanguineus TaxID=34632 RepID=A0A9D4YQV3_RHISA|nr:hypothetical protein HPB52_022251 [Rhipicephalus sanguineus]
MSPMFFYLVFLGLPQKIATIEGLHHSLYANDINLWVPEGRGDGHLEETGADAVQEFLRGMGLECSTAKSELFTPQTHELGPQNRPSRWREEIGN